MALGTEEDAVAAATAEAEFGLFFIFFSKCKRLPIIPAVLAIRPIEYWVALYAKSSTQEFASWFYL